MLARFRSDLDRVPAPLHRRPLVPRARPVLLLGPNKVIQPQTGARRQLQRVIASRVAPRRRPPRSTIISWPLHRTRRPKKLEVQTAKDSMSRIGAAQARPADTPSTRRAVR